MESKVLSEEEIKAIDAEVQRKQAEQLKAQTQAQAAEIEVKVRKEMEAKLEADRLKQELEKQKEEFNKFKTEQETRAKAQEEAFKKQLEDALAVKKGVAKNESPFQNDPNLKTLPDGSQVDVKTLDHQAIEENSRQEFLKRFPGLPRDFGKPYTKYG